MGPPSEIGSLTGRQKCRRIFYKPADAWAGDFIPFFWKGDYHLFYLKDFRGTKPGEGMPWYHISTRDFLKFADYGEALPRGSLEDQDLYVFTGCVVQRGGSFHIYYTGHNPHFPKAGKPAQGILHASSSDLVHWTKQLSGILYADPDLYETDDWRDPFVFWNSEAEEYWMLVAARLNNGPLSKRGCIGLAVSDDLEGWEVLGPFWAPGLCSIHECPDLFRWGRWWYLVYSTFSERFLTHYRMSTGLSGPWRAPADDAFDGRAFYAAKTAGDGRRRFAFGWNPTRTGDSDEGAWQWGGSLIVHELVQSADGCLGARIPQELAAAFGGEMQICPMPRMGKWRLGNGTARCEALDCFAWCSLAAVADPSLLDIRISWSPDTRGCGVLLRTDESLERYHQIRIEPGRRRVVLDRWPRPGDQPFLLERPLPRGCTTSVDLKILTDDSIVETYVDGEVALSARCYSPPTGLLGLFVSEGEVEFSNLRMRRFC